jgi:ribosomal protein S18 acetylase RimI-like enzyme
MSDPIRISGLTALTRADLERLIVGYTSSEKYTVTKREAEAQITLQLDLITLASPYTAPDPIEEDMLRRYTALAGNGLSLGVYDGEVLVGMALAEPQPWNNSLWVWEFRVAATHQQRGLGRALMETLIEKARTAGFRILVCETQTTNIPAIRFYRALGFSVEGIDLSLYSNNDLRPDGEVAMFMKRRLEPG